MPRSRRLKPVTHTLILLRHGNSEWNQKNLFTGWVDVRLSEQGVQEAMRAGELLAASGLKPDILYTSVLTRAIQTADLALEVADRLWIPVKRSWRLNERHYGALQGLDKADTLAKYGEEQFMQWRRSFDVPPPPLDDDAEYSQVHDERYQNIDGEIPRTDVRATCPGVDQALFDRLARQQYIEGKEGLATVSFRLNGSTISDVHQSRGPWVYAAAVRRAVRSLACQGAERDTLYVMQIAFRNQDSGSDMNQRVAMMELAPPAAGAADIAASAAAVDGR